MVPAFVFNPFHGSSLFYTPWKHQKIKDQVFQKYPENFAFQLFTILQ